MTRLPRYQRALVTFLVAVAWSAVAVPRAHAQFAYQELHSFEQPASPQGRVVDGGDGYVYGTASGGQFGSGTLYRIDKATKVTMFMHHFNPFTTGSGANPYGGLVDGGDGFLYGTTQSGGAFGYGTIFRFDKTTTSVTIVHSLNNNANPREGSNPLATLSLGTDGFLYGTTQSGGTNGNGTIFKVDPATGSLTVLYTFNSSSGGAYYAYKDPVVDGGDGFLYGTTYYGGANNAGTVYKLQLSTGTFTILHSFSMVTISGSTFQPLPAGVVDPGNGFLYGTTYQGGAFGWYGTVFKVSKAAGAYTLLHSFNSGGTTGYYAPAGLVNGGDGFVYGTTLYGGSGNGGTLYKVNVTTDLVSVVHSFQFNTEGQSHYDGLTISGNDLYGAAQNSGQYNQGAIYGVNKTTGATTVYSAFGREPYNPFSEVVDAGNGYLYGTTLSGAGGLGVIYKIDKTMGTRTTLHEFTSSGAASAVGYQSYAGLTDGTDGYLYGATSLGGANGRGTVYRINKTTDALSVLHPFVNAEGFYRYASLTLGTDGMLYGSTESGGANGYGAVYKVDRSSGVTTVLHSFTSAVPGGFRGDVIEGGNGFVYGTTVSGGTYNCGTLYKVSSSLPATFTILHSFNCSGGGGYYPQSGVLDGGDGFLYGTTVYGGTNGAGTVFKVDKASETLSFMHSFFSSFPQYQGSYPSAGLTLGRDGYLYGTTQQGGQYGYGTAYVIDRDTSAFGVYFSFDRFKGQGYYPQAALTQGVSPDDRFYGTTQQGGSRGGGIVFAFDDGVAGQAITVTQPPPASATYLNNFFVQASGGGSGNPVVIAASGVCSGGGNNSASISMTSGTGTCTVTFDQAGGPNYNPAPTVTRTTTAVKRFAGVSMGNFVHTFDGTPKSPTATSVSPAGLAVQLTFSGGDYGPTATPPTNAGSYTVVAAINDLNYQGTSSGTLTITKATASVSLSNLTQVYTGSALTPAVTTTPANLAVTWSGAPRTNAGSYVVTATISDTNYQGSASGTFVIQKATATVAFTSLLKTYTGGSQFPTVVTTPTGLGITWTGAPQFNAGSYAVTATISDPNYQGSASDTFVIAKATAMVTLTNMTMAYTGSPLMPTANTSPGGLAIVWTGTSQTNAGSYAVTATVNHSNFEGAASGTFVITKATVAVTLGDLTQTYTGSSLSPTATTLPAGLAVVVTGAPQTNAGTYPVTATVDDPNYQGTANGSFVIQKAPAAVTLGNLTQTYTGGALTPTATTSSDGLAIVWTGAPQTTAGSHAVTATVNDPNYQGSASDTFVIAKAAATVTLNNLSQTYTGGALTPTATTSPSGLAITWTGAPQTNAGSYAVTATVNDPNYQGSGGDTFVIAKATATVTLANLSQAFTGGALTPTATTSPAGLAIVWTGAPQTNPGSYAVIATVNNPNYAGSASGTFVIGKITPTVAWGTPAPIAYGTPLSGTQLNATANVPGTFAYTPGAGTVLGAGSQTLSATFTPSDTISYNSVNVSTQITVIHSWSNVLQPINLENDSIFKLGSTVPVKFRLVNGSASVTNLQALIFVAKVSNAIVGDELEAQSTSAADSGNTFRYDSSGGQYIFNLNTKTLSQGTWQIRIDLRDGELHTVLISLRK